MKLLSLLSPPVLTTISGSGVAPPPPSPAEPDDRWEERRASVTVTGEGEGRIPEEEREQIRRQDSTRSRRPPYERQIVNTRRAGVGWGSA